MPTAVGTRPPAYQILVELGWGWAAMATSTGHLVPPKGDRARCGAMVPRHRRISIQPTRATTCAKCRAAVGLTS